MHTAVGGWWQRRRPGFAAGPLARANDRIVFMVEPAKGRVVDPVLLYELELALDAGIQADEVQALLSPVVVSTAAPQNTVAVGHSPALIRVVAERVPGVGPAD